MILVRDLKIPAGTPMEQLPALAAKKLRISPQAIASWKLV